MHLRGTIRTVRGLFVLHDGAEEWSLEAPAIDLAEWLGLRVYVAGTVRWGGVPPARAVFVVCDVEEDVV